MTQAPSPPAPPHPPPFACPVASFHRVHASRRLQRAWRGWRATARTTASLASAFEGTGVMGVVDGGAAPPTATTPPPPAAAVCGLPPSAGAPPSSPADPAAAAFDSAAAVLQGPSTLSATRALLRRLGARVALGWAAGSADDADPVPALLARLLPGSAAATAPPPEGRYPARPFLAAFMIVAHPAVVFRGDGGRVGAGQEAADADAAPDAPAPTLAPTPEEAALSAAAAALVSVTRTLLSSLAGHPAAPPPRTAAAAFDGAWAAYLPPFAAWKVADAAALEADLVSAAVALERSRLAVVAGREAVLAANAVAVATAAEAGEGGGGDANASPPPPPRLRRAASGADVEDLTTAVDRDLALLRERVGRLASGAGLARMDAALAAVRAAPPVVDATIVSAPPPPPSIPPPSAAEQLLWAMLHAGGVGAGIATAEALWTDAEAAASGSACAGVLSVAAAEGALAEARQGAAASCAVSAAARAGAALAVARAADDARWARVYAALTVGGQGAIDTAAGALASVGAALAGCLGYGPKAAALRTRVATRLEMQALTTALATPDASLSVLHLLDTVEYVSDTVRCLCAPARDAAAAAAHTVVAARLAPLLAGAGATDAASLAANLTSALRVSAAAVRLLQADSARAETALLIATTAGGGGLAGQAARLFQQRVVEKKGDDGAGAGDDLLPSRLPLTRAWLGAAAGRLAIVEGGLPAAGDASSLPSSRVPADLRSGLVASPSSSTSTTLSVDAALGLTSGPPPLAPAPPASWRRVVRLALVGLAADRAPVRAMAATNKAATPTSRQLPETLTLDAIALAGAQHAFQLVLVCAAGALLVTQHNKAAPPALVRGRLRALLADPGAPLPDIAADLARLACVGGGEGAESQSLVATMQAGLYRLLRRDGAPFKALSGAVEAALAARLLLAPGKSADGAVRAALARAGAGDWLAGDVDALAAELASIVAVSEAVHGAAVYEPMVAELM